MQELGNAFVPGGVSSGVLLYRRELGRFQPLLLKAVISLPAKGSALLLLLSQTGPGGCQDSGSIFRGGWGGVRPSWCFFLGVCATLVSLRLSPSFLSLRIPGELLLVLESSWERAREPCLWQVSGIWPDRMT